MGQKDERRTEKRFIFGAPKQGDTFLLFNISRKGALFACPEEVKKGQRVSFDIKLPHDLAVLQANGEARWVQKVGNEDKSLYVLGVRFDDFDPAQSQILDAYIQFLERDKVIKEARDIALSQLEKLKEMALLELLKNEKWEGTIH